MSARSPLPLRGRMSDVGWDVPADLTFEEWVTAGRLLLPIRRGLDWWIGDWWAFAEKRYGRRTAIAKAEGWNLKTCANHATVSRAFPESSRRREALDWTHHAIVAGLPPDEADSLLDWCLTKSKPRSTRELQGEVNRRRITIGSARETCSVANLDSLIEQGKKFRTIYADPAWMYENDRLQPPGYYYRGITIPDICALPIRELAADDAHLHLWVVDAVMEKSFEVFRDWGFEF